MLKTQLKSKIAQLDSNWRDIEDILTGDFFGALDYLPRNPYLADFVSHITSLNPDVMVPSLNDVDWDNTKMIFWPMMSFKDYKTEPDIVIVSDKWVLVIEVKLGAGFGYAQPWREYMVGCQVAQDNSIPIDSVYYLVLARKHLDIAKTFKPYEKEQSNQLSARTSYLKWHEIVALIEFWLRGTSRQYAPLPEHRRMLIDLFTALRKRRAIAFSGFAFANAETVVIETGNIFCPPRFTGFLYHIPETEKTEATVFLFHGHRGFLATCPNVETSDQSIFLDKGFRGFGKHIPKVTQNSNYVFWAPSFTPFLITAFDCKKYDHVFQKGLNP